MQGTRQLPIDAADRTTTPTYTPRSHCEKLQSWEVKRIGTWSCRPHTTRSWRLVPSASRSTASIRTACGNLPMAASTESRALLGELLSISALRTTPIVGPLEFERLIRHQQAPRSSRIWLRLGQALRVLATEPLAPTLQRCDVARV
jgi:hypothetical protein